MKYKTVLGILIFFIVILSLTATIAGIFSTQGPGNFEFTSIHGQEILIYGKGVYRNMSVLAAPDGIAQDYVTLILAIPLLIISFFWAKKDSLKGNLLLAGVLFYFLFTYLLYMVLIMYNELFLLYVVLTSLSFFAFALTVMPLNVKDLVVSFKQELPVRFIGGFLIFISVLVGLNWLGRIVPPLLDGSLIPQGIEHYTTLPVQGLDLAFVLPIVFLSGVLLIKRKALAYLLAPIFVNFLVIMLLAISAKLVGQSLQGTVGVFPLMMVFLIFSFTAVISSILIMKNIKEE
ncbi:MAG: hypothetical protein FH762_04895 [Firmicutes bacterium]|nr:hypothetical protein [Bacillota bacterium]